MDNREPPVDVPIIEQVKIQARVLVPLLKALQAELGEARANALMRKTLGELYRKLGEKWWQRQHTTDLGANLCAAFRKYAAGGALDYVVIRQSSGAFEANVTRCRYAEFFQELGVPELGFLLVCSADFAMAEGFGSDVRLTRTRTIMQGATHCDFRYSRATRADRSE